MFKVILLSLLACALVLRADQAYIIQTIAGSSDAGDNGPATAALLMQAEGIAIDGLGNIYISDAGDNRIRKINAHGVIQTIAGTGVGGFAGDGGPAIAAQLNRPYGIALDFSGNIYVADLGNARIRKIDSSGVITTVAGGGTTAITPAGIPQAKEAQLASPRNVAVDVLNNIYISDFDAHQVYQVTTAGSLTVLAGTGKAGFSGDGNTAAAAQLKSPAGLAADVNGNVFVADSGNNRIRRIWRGSITTVATDVPSPTGVALDAAGHVYVASSSVASAQRVPTPAGLTVEAYPSEDIASDPNGILFLASQHSIQKVAGISTTVIAGASPSAPSTFGDGGPATSARLVGPVAVSMNATGEIHIAEQSANRIRKVAADGTISALLSDSSQVGSPSAIADAAAGTIYFADIGNNRVRRISAGNVLSTAIDKLSSPSCTRIGVDGSLYVCDKGNDRIVRIAPSGMVSNVPNVSKPSGLAVASDGTLYASSGSQVLEISPSGTSTVLLDNLYGPSGLALTSAGELLIVETGKNRLLKFGAAGAVMVLAGTGQAGFAGDGKDAAAALLNSPQDVSIDAAGNILIADTGNNRIRKLTAAAAPVAAPIVTPPAAQPPPTPTPVSLSPVVIVNSASQLIGSVAPNEIITIYGTGFDNTHTQVTFDGLPATVFYAGPTQLNVLIPAAIKPNATTALSVTVNGMRAGSATLQTVPAAPAIFTTSNGTGQAAALNDDGSVNSTANPEARGGIVVLYLTGDGQSAAAAVSVRIGDSPADVLYAGPAPGFPGLTQVNAHVPAGSLLPGPQPVVVTYGGVSTQAGVTIAVR